MTTDQTASIIHSTYEEKIQITNTSMMPLNNIQIILEKLNINISQYKVVRERGSLTFSSSQKLIELGNLIPNETAELYFSIPIDSNTANPISLPLEDIQIAYSLDSEEPILSNLDKFLEVTHKD